MKSDGRAWRRLRSQVVIRDHGQCWICGHYGAKSADHIWPRTEGGPNLPENLNASHARGSPCPDCSIAAGRKVCCNERRQYGSWERARRKIETATRLRLPLPMPAQLHRAKFALERWGKGTTLEIPEQGLPGPLTTEPEGREWLPRLSSEPIAPAVNHFIENTRLRFIASIRITPPCPRLHRHRLVQPRPR